MLKIKLFFESLSDFFTTHGLLFYYCKSAYLCLDREILIYNILSLICSES